MLAGMYVTHDGDVCQVVNMTGDTRTWAGLPVPVTLYHLVPVAGGPARFVIDPKASDIPLTPACDACGLPAGFNKCTAQAHQLGVA